MTKNPDWIYLAAENDQKSWMNLFDSRKWQKILIEFIWQPEMPPAAHQPPTSRPPAATSENPAEPNN